VAEATIRVVLEGGLEAASMQAIARELGETVGVLTYYFRNKDELMLAALAHAMGDLLGDARRAAAGKRGLERLEAMVTATLPIRRDRRRGWRVWVAFLGQTVAHPGLIRAQRRRYEEFHRGLGALVGELIRAGVLPKRSRPREIVNGLIALVDGIGIGSAIRPADYPEVVQRRLVRQYLEGLSKHG